MSKGKKRNSYASLTAEIHNVTPHYVRMVLRQERTNEEILETYMTIAQESNRLLEEVKKTVPFPPSNYNRQTQTTA